MALLKSRRDLISPPNLFSYLRLALTLPVCLLMLQPGAAGWWGFALFIVAAGTDKVDGWLAKRNNGLWKTTWGAIIDPFIDKALVVAVLGRAVTLTHGDAQVLLVFVLSVTLIREFVVGFGKLHQPVKSAAEAGRFTMAAQSVAVTLLLLPPIEPWNTQVKLIFVALFIALGASLLSGWLYVTEWLHLRRMQLIEMPRLAFPIAAIGVGAAIAAVLLTDQDGIVIGLSATLGATLCASWAVWKNMLQYRREGR